MIRDPVQSFNDQWMIYDYWQHADNPDIRLEAKYDVGNVRIQDNMLQLQQLGYTDRDEKKGHHVSIAGLQTKRQDIIHGTFRTTFKVEGASGGSCAAWFWHRDDDSELDIEAITRGNSLVNNTINYTTHPSQNANGSAIPNATLSVPLSKKYNTNLEVFHEHRFDSDRAGGAKYYIDGHLMHTDGRRVPKLGGNLQLKLWADGNKWWSGHPSSTTVTMSVKSVIAYFNTTSTVAGTDQEWFDTCAKAGGPSKDTVCEAYARIDKDDDLPLAASGVPISQPSTTRSVSKTMAAVTKSSTRSATCPTNVGMGGTCLPTSQAARTQSTMIAGLHRLLTRTLSGLRGWHKFPAQRNVTDAVLSQKNDECCYSCSPWRLQRATHVVKSMHSHDRRGDNITTVIPESPEASPTPLQRRNLCCAPCTIYDSQAARNQPLGFGLVNHVKKCLSRLSIHFPVAARHHVGFAPEDNRQDTTPDPLARGFEQKHHPVKSQLGPRVSQMVVGGYGGPPFLLSQGGRNIPSRWLPVPKFLKVKVQNLSSRDGPACTLPFGSPVDDDDEEDDEVNATVSKSQGAKFRPPLWFNTLYARNSTPIAYKNEQASVVRGLVFDTSKRKDKTRIDHVEGCAEDKNEHCSFGQVLDIGKWWRCLRKRSDWRFFFSGSSFLLTNGLIQIISVPVIFAWVFYITEG